MAFQFAPYQIPPHDGTEDITDSWLEETDPGNERGECCDAFFIDQGWRNNWHCELIAIRVTGGVGPDLWSVCLPRDMALRQLGRDAVKRIENARAERLYSVTP